MVELLPGERLDTINEKLSLIQKKDGLMFGTDAYLLAAYAKDGKALRAAELGAGTGVVSLLMLAKDKAETVYAIEAQPEFARLTERNAEMNGLSRRLITVEADVRTVDENTLGGRVDVVFSNPPYMRADCGRENAESVKNIARREVLGGIFDFCACAARILKYGGLFYTVYRPERLPDLMEALRANRLEPKKLTFVHATAEKAPSMVLVASRLGGNPSLTVTPPLLVYRSPESREYTDAMKQIYESCSFEELEGF